MENLLFQKTGIIVSELALDFASRNIGDRIPSVSEYQQLFGASRGTVQNGIKFLKDQGAVTFQNRGHMGTIIMQMDMGLLQKYFADRGILGAMPLPYSKLYQGLATALELKMEGLACNLVYTRGAQGRICLVEEAIYQFAICSKHAAQKAIEDGSKVEIAMDFGPGTYLSKHVLLFANPEEYKIKEGMRIAYDPTSIDHRDITKILTDGISDIHLVEIRAHQTVGKLLAGEIDAGVWNYDEIIETGYQGLHYVELSEKVDISSFSSAVLLVGKGKNGMKAILKKYIDIESTCQIQQEVKMGRRMAIY